MSKFSVWIDDINVSTGCQSADVFASDNQRITGFKAGTGASAIRVNTALRQANLIAVALVNALDIPLTYDVTSSLTDITSWFKSTQTFKLQELFSVGIENKIKQNLQPETDNTIGLGIDTKRFASIFTHDIDAKDVTAETVTASNGIIGDLEGRVDGERISATYLKKANIITGRAVKRSGNISGDYSVNVPSGSSWLLIATHQSNISSAGNNLRAVILFTCNIGSEIDSGRLLPSLNNGYYISLSRFINNIEISVNIPSTLESASVPEVDITLIRRDNL